MATEDPPAGDERLRTSLLRNLGGGAALIALVAVVFAGVGQVAGPDAPPEVAGSVGDQRSDEEPDGSDEGEEPEPADESDAGEAAEEPEPARDPEEPAEDADESAEEDAEEPVEEDEPAAGQDQAAAIAPGEISVQVLDGVGTDGGAAAGRVASELGETGYRVVAQNPALAYEVTTVLWTQGNEDRARQVAAAVGAPEVRQQPGNLSEQVDVHVVVGADRA